MKEKSKEVLSSTILGTTPAFEQPPNDYQGFKITEWLVCIQYDRVSCFVFKRSPQTRQNIEIHLKGIPPMFPFVKPLVDAQVHISTIWAKPITWYLTQQLQRNRLTLI